MNQSCRSTREALSAYIDDELAPDRAQEIAEHLTRCAQCSTEYQALLETIAALQTRLTRYSAPDVLRARIRSTIAVTPTESAESRRALPLRRERRRSWRFAAGLAAAVVVSAALGSGITLLAGSRTAGGQPIAAEVLSSHVRSLMPDHLTDIRSTDQHNVKPWFNGRLDFSPTVPRLEEQGFPLVGGRVDYVGGRPVAVVVYARRQHMINVFSWPTSSGDEPLAATAAKGYNMLHWRSGGSEHWVVSDLNATELKGFAELLRG